MNESIPVLLYQLCDFSMNEGNVLIIFSVMNICFLSDKALIFLLLLHHSPNVDLNCKNQTGADRRIFPAAVSPEDLP